MLKVVNIVLFKQSYFFYLVLQNLLFKQKEFSRLFLRVQIFANRVKILHDDVLMSANWTETVASKKLVIVINRLFSRHLPC